MRETLKNIYDAHQLVRALTWAALAGVALLLYVIEGGFPPPIWILFWQSIRGFSHLWTTHGVSTLFTVMLLAILSLIWLVVWILLLGVCLRIFRHHRGLQDRQAQRTAWQTMRRISDLDAFSLPGEHTLARTMMDNEDDEDEEGDEDSTSIELRPPIRLPQHSQFVQYAQPAQHVQRASATASSSVQSAPSVRRTQAARQSPLVAVKDMADIPTTPASLTAQASSTPKVVRSIETARNAKRPAATQQEGHKTKQTASSQQRVRANVASVAVEDIPTTPHPPSTHPSSPRRTQRLDPSVRSQADASPPPSPRTRTSLTLETGVGWHTGLTRQSQPNEDSVVTLRGMCTYREQLVPFGLFVVADGMGGHACGQEASRIAIRTLAQAALRDIMQPETLDDKQLIELLARAVEQANSAIYQRGQEWEKDMGTTLTAALIVDTKTSVMAYVVNAGDSRTYLLGQGEPLQQITRDHSLVANLVASGAITPDAVYEHPERNKIYRSLGNNASIDIDWFTRELRSGDTLLLCSDGLWEMVRDPEIERILRQPIEPTRLCNQLIQSALKGGGADNVSAVVVRIS